MTEYLSVDSTHKRMGSMVIASNTQENCSIKIALCAYRSINSFTGYVFDSFIDIIAFKHFVSSQNAFYSEKKTLFCTYTP